MYVTCSLNCTVYCQFSYNLRSQNYYKYNIKILLIKNMFLCLTLQCLVMLVMGTLLKQVIRSVQAYSRCSDWSCHQRMKLVLH
jgi:hypothetical protein